MSTLKTHNLQSPDAASANIALTPNAGMVVAGVTTIKSGTGSGFNSTYNGRTTAIIEGDNAAGTVLSIMAKSSGYSGLFFGDESAEASGQIQYIHSSNSFKFNTSGGTANLVLDGGKVGIGTQVPAEELEVNGDISSTNLYVTSGGDTAKNNISGKFSHGGINSKSLVIGADPNNVGGNTRLQFDVDGTERMRVDSSGLVGIGTDNPSNPLHITGADPQIKIQDSANGNNAQIFLDGPNSNLNFDWVSGADRKINFINSGSGDISVGINTNTPTEQLEIYNGASNSNTTFRMRSLDGSTQIYLDARGTNDSNFIYFTDSSATYNSFIQRSHSSNAAFAGLRYCYDGSASEAFRISESGGFDMGGSGYGTAGQVLKSNGDSPPTWSGGAQRVLEVVASPCDGSTISTSNGDVTFQNVTGVQNLSTTFTDVTGSKITYTPPTGTTQVIYEFNFQASRLDGLAISHYRMYIDGNEVTYMRSEIAAEDQSVRTTIRWIFNIGGSTNNATGRQASWTSGKEIKLQAEDYGSSYDIQLHETNWWNGAGTDQFSMPTLSLTAIGV